MDAMRDTARELVAPGKGILAADESSGTIKKRFDSIGVESTEDNRRGYRQLLFTTAGLGDHISGRSCSTRRSAKPPTTALRSSEVLEKAGVIPGIKVDTGAHPLALFEGETVTEGLDGLRERLAEYGELGARFAKWRATYFVGAGHALRLRRPRERARDGPLRGALPGGRHRPDRGARGPDGRRSRPRRVRGGDREGARRPVRPAPDHRVDLAGSLLKVNMVVPGKGAATQDDDAAIAEATLRTLRDHVPAEVPGIVFLSGGMTDEEATSRLNAINALGEAPWEISFSYGRALQQAPLKAWSGDAANVEAAQAALAHRARMNGLARSGEWSASLEVPAA